MISLSIKSISHGSGKGRMQICPKVVPRMSDQQELHFQAPNLAMFAANFASLHLDHLANLHKRNSQSDSSALRWSHGMRVLRPEVQSCEL